MCDLFLFFFFFWNSSWQFQLLRLQSWLYAFRHSEFSRPISTQQTVSSRKQQRHWETSNMNVTVLKTSRQPHPLRHASFTQHIPSQNPAFSKQMIKTCLYWAFALEEWSSDEPCLCEWETALVWSQRNEYVAVLCRGSPSYDIQGCDVDDDRVSSVPQ